MAANKIVIVMDIMSKKELDASYLAVSACMYTKSKCRLASRFLNNRKID